MVALIDLSLVYAEIYPSFPVIYLDRSGADLKPDPLHPLNIQFEARSATELQCSYILFIVSLSTNLV